jgi:hypothetical protein
MKLAKMEGEREAQGYLVNTKPADCSRNDCDFLHKHNVLINDTGINHTPGDINHCHKYNHRDHSDYNRHNCHDRHYLGSNRQLVE